MVDIFLGLLLTPYYLFDIMRDICVIRVCTQFDVIGIMKQNVDKCLLLVVHQTHFTCTAFLFAWLLDVKHTHTHNTNTHLSRNLPQYSCNV